LDADVTYHLIASLASGAPVSADTSIIFAEDWDDPMPIGDRTYDAFADYYAPLNDPVLGFTGRAPILRADTEEKRDGYQRWLDSADYIVLASQRNLWSLPRLPFTFPLTIAYYDALFDGSLGFELVNSEQADLHIGPLYINDTAGTLSWGEASPAGWPPPGDLAAEEAFSVYDHAPVWIFQKSDEYDSQQVAAVLDTVDLTQVIPMNPGQASAAPTGLLLDEADFAAQKAGGTFSERFALDSVLNQNPYLAAVVWWIATIVLGWLAFPLVFVVLRGLPTRGYALARILALLLISYVAWLLGSVGWVEFGRNSLLIGLALLVITSVTIGVWRRKTLFAYFNKNANYIILVELLALVLFAIGIGIRLGNPDVWDVIWGGEKPMDLSYFNAVLKSTSFPPYNPWLSGSYINYYYYGYVFVSVPTLLLGIVPTTAYNLIIPMLFSFTGIGAFSVAYNLVVAQHLRKWLSADEVRTILNRKAVLAGLVAVALSILLGNLAEIRVALDMWQRLGDPSLGSPIAQTVDGIFKMLSGQPSTLYPGDWFFTATRAIGFAEGEAVPITEFPYFTFLYADLHAHMISLPLTMLALGWAVSWALYPIQWLQEEGRFGRILLPILTFIIGGIAIGVLYPTNSWDWPTYLVIGFLAIILHNYRRYQTISMRMVGSVLLQIAALGILSYITFLPFWTTFGSGYTTLKGWEGSTTDLISFLSVYGLFLLIVMTHLAREGVDWVGSFSAERRAKIREWAFPLILSAVAMLIVMGLIVLAGYPVAPLSLTLIAVAGVLSLRADMSAERRIVLALIAAAFFFTLFVEFFVLDGDISRMNTVFKFYMQVWMLLSITCGVAFAWLLPALRTEWGQTPRRVWLGALGVLVFLALLYPVLATKAKWGIRMSAEAPTTLDGMAFMETTSYFDSDQNVSLAPEYAALQWMQRNIDGTPIVMEAHGKNPYRSIASRVAMYTGLPSVVGWDWHQRQQRAVLPEAGVWSRIGDVDNFYNTTDIDEAQCILEKYDVEYVYAGTLESVYYAPEGVAKLDTMVENGTLELVYDDQGIQIYEVGR
jgi:YYY domain-containing protein